MFDFYEIQHYTGVQADWLQTLLGGLIGALISAGIAWYISRRNIKDQKKIESNRLTVEQNAELDYFIYLVSQVIVNKSKILDSDEKYSADYKSHPLARSPLVIELTGNIDRLRNLSINYVRKAIHRRYEKDKPEGIVRKLIGIVDFYHTHSVQRVERIEFLSKQRDDIGERLVRAMDDLRFSIKEKIVELHDRGEDHPSYKYYNLFRKIIDKYEDGLNFDTSPDFGFHEKYLVEPFAKSANFDNRIVGHYIELYSKCYQVQNLLGRLRSNSLDLSGLVDQFNQSLKKQNEKGEEIIRKYFNADFNIEAS